MQYMITGVITSHSWYDIVLQSKILKSYYVVDDNMYERSGKLILDLYYTDDNMMKVDNLLFPV